MAISPIAVGDVNTRAKINAAIVEANKVGSKADAGATAASLASRALYSEVGPMRDRPGEPGRFFTATLDGAPSVVAPIADNLKVPSPAGLVAQLAGAGRLAPIAAFRVEPGHQYRARFAFWRSVDSEDPAGDAVQLGLRWLTSSKAGLSSTELANLLDLRVENGRLEYVFNFATVAADNIDAAAPAGAVYVRPYIRTFSYGTTQVEVIEVTDLTLAADWSPDVTSLRNEIAGLTQRLDDALARIATLETT